MYHYYTAISVCAAALTDRVYVEADYGRIYPAMWIALIGESKFRKTTAISLATRLLKRADQELELPQTFSAEAIIEHLSHRPYGLLRWGEMGVGLEFLSKDYASGIISSLVQLWDGEGMTRLTKEGGATNIDHAALSILAGGKRQWFLRYAKDKRNVAMGVGTGFFGRWMFVIADKKGPYRGIFERNGSYVEADRLAALSMVDHLASLRQHEGEIDRGPGSLIIDARLALLERQWTDDSDPAEFAQRASANITKLCIGIQACRGTAALLELEEGAAKQAIELWEHSFRSGRELVEMIMGQSEDAEELQRCDAALRELGGRASQRELLRKLKVTLGRFLIFAGTLKEQGRWLKEEVPNPGNHPSIFWKRI